LMEPAVAPAERSGALRSAGQLGDSALGAAACLPTCLLLVGKGHRLHLLHPLQALRNRRHWHR
jgi:hypothetical protein